MKITPDLLRDTSEVVTINVANLEEFEARIAELEAAHERLMEDADSYLPAPVFRGQANAAWGLDTTLERYPIPARTLADYYQSAFSARYEIESASGHQWELPYPFQFFDAIKSSALDLRGLPPSVYAYFVYLRHHGFPSPLLDWTRSPYIANFFAFESQPAGDVQKVAVFAYMEHTGVGKVNGSGPRIVTLGPNVRTHRRHYLQQAEYTMCARKLGENWHFSEHHRATNTEAGQDVLLKFLLPVSERHPILLRLDKANLNSFSLYGSEEALMRTMALREFEFSGQVQRRERVYRNALAEALERQTLKAGGRAGDRAGGGVLSDTDRE
jgi:hypothetical protein